MNYILSIILLVFIASYTFLMPRIILKRDIISLKLITLEIVLQNIMCIFASAFFSNTLSQMILLYKGTVLYGTVLLSFFYNNPIKIKKVLCLCWL